MTYIHIKLDIFFILCIFSNIAINYQGYVSRNIFLYRYALFILLDESYTTMNKTYLALFTLQYILKYANDYLLTFRYFFMRNILDI